MISIKYCCNFLRNYFFFFAKWKAAWWMHEFPSSFFLDFLFCLNQNHMHTSFYIFFGYCRFSFPIFLFGTENEKSISMFLCVYKVNWNCHDQKCKLTNCKTFISSFHLFSIVDKWNWPEKFTYFQIFKLRRKLG